MAKRNKRNIIHVWGYSTLAVVIISVTGLIGVSIIPLMRQVFYDSLIQFLVALAVGALSGDAMLHLLPHAMTGDPHNADAHDSANDSILAGHSSHSDSHGNEVWKGMCGLAGIVFFFIMERILSIYSDYVKEKKVLLSTINASMHSNWKMDKGRDGLTTSANRLSAHLSDVTPRMEDIVMSESVSSHTASRQTMPEVVADSHLHSHEHSQSHAHVHGHTHGPIEIPTSVAAIAWMVILGDGIHNFTDGLALGAAFANSATSGLSTSIAIFCHELPHEIGDFAVLLAAGMSVKQSIIYNMASSVLCFLGMVVGVLIGNVGDVSLWIFATIAGMFLYISLVDMLPELMKSPREGTATRPFFTLFLHISGICTGAGIMTLIAVYETSLVTMLDES